MFPPPLVLGRVINPPSELADCFVLKGEKQQQSSSNVTTPLSSNSPLDCVCTTTSGTRLSHKFGSEEDFISTCPSQASESVYSPLAIWETSSCVFSPFPSEDPLILFAQLKHGLTEYYFIPGAGPIILLIHGFGESASSLHSLAFELATETGRPIAYFSRYGNGLSSGPDVAHDVTLFTEQISEFVDVITSSTNSEDVELTKNESQKRVIIYGRGIGNFFAASFVTAFPERVLTLILTNPPRVMGPTCSRIMASAARAVWNFRFTPFVAEFFLEFGNHVLCNYLQPLSQWNLRGQPVGKFIVNNLLLFGHGTGFLDWWIRSSHKQHHKRSVLSLWRHMPLFTDLTNVYEKASEVSQVLVLLLTSKAVGRQKQSKKALPRASFVDVRRRNGTTTTVATNGSSRGYAMASVGLHNAIACAISHFLAE